MDVSSIRIGTKTALSQLGIFVPDHLPLLEGDLTLRSADSVVDRILCMHATAATAYGFSADAASKWIHDEDLANSLTKKERKFINSGVGNASEFQVQIEGMWALAWSLSFLDSIKADEPCRSDFVTLLPDLRRLETASVFREAAHARPVAQVAEAMDIAFCLHWHLVDTELHNKGWDLEIAPYGVIERRRAFEWLLSDSSWDDVPLDT